MTPAARLQAAIEILDIILDGDPAEKALTGWARRSRYAGSKDRAAVRDHVFTALRCRRSHAALGGANTGRGLILGGLRDIGEDPDTLFTGDGYGPAALSDAEREAGRKPAEGAEACDLQDWIYPAFSQSLGAETAAAAAALRLRAPVHVRVNLTKATVETAQDALAEAGIQSMTHPAASTALEITEGARKIRNSEAYTSGLVELQDAASQAVIAALPLSDGMRVLDYCAGGGGKSLAMAAQAGIDLFAHDAAPQRMRDLPERAERAGADITVLSTSEARQQAPFDLVLCDVPCSGSGSWRRAPDAKWLLTPETLDELLVVQATILDEAADLVTENGSLAFATCSMLEAENGTQVEGFLARHPGWSLDFDKSWRVHGGTDGFYVAILTQRSANA